MKKIITAIDNNYLLEKLNKKNNIKIIFNNLLYREAILEILEKIKNINYILISEKIPGEISIEDLIKKIKIINNKINIIFILEKEDLKKKNKLRKLGIQNIYLNNKNNFNKIINLIEDNKDNKIISIYGKNKSGKTTIANLLIYYFLNKNKKILIINLNKNIEKNYLILLRKKYLKNKNNKLINKEKNNNKKINSKNNFKKENNFNNLELKINKNLFLICELGKISKSFCQSKNYYEEKFVIDFLNLYSKKYDYIIVDIGNNCNKDLRNKFIESSDKKLFVIDNNPLGIKEAERFVKKCKEKNYFYKGSLHIIQNKYYFWSFSNLILRNIFEKSVNFNKINFSKNYKNLAIKILKKEKVRINVFNNFQIRKILN